MVDSFRFWEVAKLNKLAIFKTVFTLMVAFTTMSGSMAFAQGKSDSFNRNTGPAMGGASSGFPISGNAALGKNDPISRWFDAMDLTFYENRVPHKTAMEITRDFGQDPVKLNQWTNAVKVAIEKYRSYARAVRSLPLPPGLGPEAAELKDFRNANADLADDTAQYLSDWITPRLPAATKEELQAQLDQMHKRSVSLNQQNTELLRYDKELRTKYDVRDRDDALMRYVAKRPASN
jgi:hypothetical protein